MPAGTVCVAVYDGGMQRLVLVDVGRGTSEVLGEGLWVDDIGSWDGAILVKGHRGDDSTTVWTVERSGGLQPFAPLAGRGVHGLGVGADGTVVVAVPYEGAGWWHRGTDLLLVSPDDGQTVLGAGALGGHGTVRVQLRGDDPRLGVALDSARYDLYRLDTDPAEEGEVEIPSFVSEIQSHSAGPWVWIDANDTELSLLERIPTIVTRHLHAAGIIGATIDLDPDVDLPAGGL